jgi:hypothetical protein
MRIKTILVFFFFISSLVSGQSIKISLLNSKDINAVTLNIRQGKYLVKNGKATFFMLAVLETPSS